jgi:hypothetical protein
MARRLCQTLLAIALGYLAALGLFALLAYRGPRPDVLTMARHFHLFVVGRGAPPRAPEEPGEVPPEAPPVPAPRPEDPALPSAAPAPAPADPRPAALARVRGELLPEAERRMAAIRPDATALMDEKAHARAVLVTARDLLGELLDRDRGDEEAQKLYKRVMELLIALDKR